MGAKSRPPQKVVLSIMCGNLIIKRHSGRVNMKTNIYEFLGGGERVTLRERRKAAGLRQVDVAKKLVVNQAAVSNWERGAFKPLRKYWKPLARLYGCTAAEIEESYGEKDADLHD